MDDLQLLKNWNVVVKAHFKGKSEKHGDWYVDKDVLCFHLPYLAKRLKTCPGMLRFEGRGIDVVVGPEKAGIVFGSLVALHMQREFVYAEKGDGKDFKIRETFAERVKGKTVLLVDDVLNMAATSAPTVRMLESHGARVVGAYFFVTRGNVGAREVGVPLVESMMSVSLPMWDVADCAECKAGVPLSNRYGHGAKK